MCCGRVERGWNAGEGAVDKDAWAWADDAWADDAWADDAYAWADDAYAWADGGWSGAGIATRQPDLKPDLI